MKRHALRRWGVVCFVVTSAVLLFPSCLWWCAQGTEFVVSVADWLPQDYVDSRGVTSVVHEKGQLIVTADLDGQDAERGSGEIVLDLHYFPGLEDQVPLDLSETTLTVRLNIPREFVGSSSAPNGIQAFMKDENWAACYSRWFNVDYSGNYKIEMRPGEGDGNITTEGFDASRVRTLGVKFGMNDMSHASFQGTLTVESVRLTPALTFSPMPELPARPPVPLSREDRFDLRSDGFYLQGQQRFLAGANWQPIAYGQNFGATAWFPGGNGVSRRSGFVRETLDLAVRAGITLLRVGLLDDGRTALDADARVTGYSELFREDVRALLDIAADLGCRIEFVLMDYQLAGKADTVEGVPLRGRSQLLRDVATRDAFVTEFLVPFLDEFGAHPGLFGVDIINEPEWIVGKADGGAWEDVNDVTVKPEAPVSGADFNVFVTACVNTIRAYAPQLFVTVGISAPFTSLIQDLGLDYLALHHYPWMGDFPEGLPDPLPSLPWMLEEYPTRSTSLTITDYLDGAKATHAVGALFWNLSPGLDEATFTHEERNRILESLRDWVDKD